MGSFQIEGGHRLKGDVIPQGAKNEALQILCAVLLTDEKVTISNIPDIVDVNKLIGLLKKMGVKVTNPEKGKYTFKSFFRLSFASISISETLSALSQKQISSSSPLKNCWVVPICGFPISIVLLLNARFPPVPE